MKIQTEQDMNEFCEEVNRLGRPISITLSNDLTPADITKWQRLNYAMIGERKLNAGSHLQSKITDITFDSNQSGIFLKEAPCLYPSPQIAKEHEKFTGITWGVLSNAFDPQNKLFLFHMRGRDISSPFGFQAAAAGMSVFGVHPYVVAVETELREEAGNLKTIDPLGDKAVGISPFMKKAGEKAFPQPLFSFVSFYDSTKIPALIYPVLSSLDQIAEFEAYTKKGLEKGTIMKREGYHFHVPIKSVDSILEGLRERWYGPIPESHSHSERVLRNNGYLC